MFPLIYWGKAAAVHNVTVTYTIVVEYNSIIMRTEWEPAYAFIRSRLIYISAPEIQHMVELVYPTLVERTLVSAIADHCHLPTYLVWSTQHAARLLENL